MRSVGIDPGKSGACALFVASSDRGLGGAIADAIDMPLLGDLIDARALARWLDRMKPDHVWIERVSAMPSIPGKPEYPGGPEGPRRDMGATSAFDFGRSAGIIHATVSVCGWPLSYVTPGKWKKFYGLKGPNKEQSRLRAIELMPAASDFLTRKKDAGRAEAMLIGRYGVMASRVESAVERQWGERKPEQEIPE